MTCTTISAIHITKLIFTGCSKYIPGMHGIKLIDNTKININPSQDGKIS